MLSVPIYRNVSKHESCATISFGTVPTLSESTQDDKIVFS